MIWRKSWSESSANKIGGTREALVVASIDENCFDNGVVAQRSAFSTRKQIFGPFVISYQKNLT
jgi:hypothetical protein